MSLTERLVKAIEATHCAVELVTNGEVLIKIQDGRPVLVEVTSKFKP